MKGNRLKKCLAILMGVILAAEFPSSHAVPFGLMDSYAYTGAATVKASSLNVRSGAGTGYSSVGRLAAGAAITIIGEQRGTDGNTWYQIQYTGSSGSVNTGYVSSLYVRIPVSYSTDADFEAYLTSQGFPESYKNGLRQLHAQYPNWVFKAKNTGLDWNTVIENEMVLGRNLVSSGSVSSWKSVESGAYNWDNSTWTGFDGSGWVAASKDIVSYYMDPRNFLDETYVFQFLTHEYNASTQTKEGLESMIAGTFLSGSTDSTGTGGSDFSSGGSSHGSGSAGGPGSTEGPGGSSTGSNRGPGAADLNDYSQSGPGVSGGGSSPSVGTSPSGGNSGVSLEAPHASITPKDRSLVASSVSLEAPGASQEASAPGGSQSPSTGSTQGPSQNGPSSSGGETASPGSTGTGTGTSMSYADIIMKAASQSGVSPYVLAAMILQEQGAGTSPLISGTYSGYEGYYNYFNVEAYQSGSMSAIQTGLRYASQSGSYGRPWNTVEKSIIGGAQNYGDNYVKAGQNTFYLKKFNVQGENLYKHQYMTNIQGAASEGAKLEKAYSSVKNSALEFHIPVYNNMPEQACVAPTGDGSPNNKLSNFSVEGFGITPSFSRDTERYNLIVDTSVSSIQINANTADSTASVSGAGTVSLPDGETDITVSVTAQNGSVRNYVLHVVKQAGGPVSGSTGTVTSPGGAASPGTSQGQSGSQGPGSTGTTDSGSGPGGSNVTIVQVP